MISVVLADDHQLVRQGMRLLLEAEGDLEIVGQAADGSEAVALARRLKPDVLIVDMVMSGLSGLEVTRQVKQLLPATGIVVLSMYDTEAYVVESLAAGASAYVLKKATSSDLVQAVRRVRAGGIFLSPPLDANAVNAYIQHARDEPADPYDTLSEREREVLFLAADGMSNPQIAARLSLSARTVEMHRARMMRKLRLKSQTQLVKYAIKRGILSIE